MARRAARTTKSASPPPAPARGGVASVLDLARRFPVQAGLGLAATVIAILVGVFELWDRFGPAAPAAAPEEAVALSLVETELGALSGGTMQVLDDGTRAFTGGLKARVQLSLRQGAARAVVNAVALVPVAGVPPAVTTLAGTERLSLTPSEEFSWAGARPVDTYLGELRGEALRVVYNDGAGRLAPCAPENVLTCDGNIRVIELSETGDTTHTLDLQLAYRDAAPRGVALVVRYAVDGAEHEARTETLYLFN